MKPFKLRAEQKKQIGLICAAMLTPMVLNAQSLEQAVAYTFDTHPEIRAAYTQFKVNEKQVEQAQAGYLPTLDATAGYGYEYTDSPSTRSSGDDSEDLMRRELGLSIKQNLFSGFHTRSEVSRTRYSTSAEQWRLFAKAEDLALEVSKVYVALIEAEELIKLSEKNLASHQAIYEQIKQRTESGFGSSADLSQIEGRLAKAQSNLIAAKNNYLDSRTVFYRVIAQQPDNLVIPYPDASLLPASKEAGLKTALAKHPVIQAAANDINAARYQHDAAKSNYYPKLSLEIDANFDDNLDGVDGSAYDPSTGGEYNEVQAMLRVSYNLYSGGKDQAYAQETAYKWDEAKALNSKAHREVTESFNLSWDAFEQLKRQKKYIKLHVIASKDTQSDYQQQFRIGQRTLLDLLDTENELYQARTDFLEAEFSEITAQYRILHAMGLLVDALRVTRPESWQGEKQYAGGVGQ